MNPFEYEAGYIEIGLEQFKPYLLSGEVYWNLGARNPKGQPPYPQLTLGNMLLAAAKLGQGKQAPASAAELLARLDQFREEWASAWKGKAGKEFGVRLRQWTRFLDSLSGGDGAKAALKSEVRGRAVLQLLAAEMEGAEAELAELAVQDARFRRLTEEGDFLWDEALAGGFKPESYWFLYRKAK